MGIDVNARWQRISIENNANYDITEKKRTSFFVVDVLNLFYIAHRLYHHAGKKMTAF